MFRELNDEGLEPWAGVHQVLVAGSPADTHGVDVSDFYELGVASLEAHAAYLAGLGDNPMSDPAEFLESISRANGTRLGTAHAVTFEIFDF